MLSGEGNENGKKTTTTTTTITIGLISKKATLHVQHTFLYTCKSLIIYFRAVSPTRGTGRERAENELRTTVAKNELRSLAHFSPDFGFALSKRKERTPRN